MLHAVATLPSYYGLSGFGAAANPAIRDLQLALQQFATARGVPMADPGTVDGVIGPNTRNAVFAVLPFVPKIPSAVKKALQAAQIATAFVPSLQAQTDQMITSYAKEIATAIRVLIVATASTPTSTGTSTTALPTVPALPVIAPLPTAASPLLLAPPWYATTGGKVALGAGALTILGAAAFLACR